MEVVRQFIDANSLMSVMALPEAFRGRKLEVIVLPAEDPTPEQRKADIPLTVQSLLGAIPYADKTLPELRGERLGKYETFS